MEIKSKNFLRYFIFTVIFGIVTILVMTTRHIIGIYMCFAFIIMIVAMLRMLLPNEEVKLKRCC